MPPRKTSLKTSPAKAAPSSPSITKSKRKPVSASADSDIEIVSVSTHQIKKKRVASPEPGSPAYEDLPAVTIISDVEEDIFNAVLGVKFGSVDDADEALGSDSLQESPSKTSSRRTKIKMEEAHEDDASPKITGRSKPASAATNKNATPQSIKPSSAHGNIRQRMTRDVVPSVADLETSLIKTYGDASPSKEGKKTSAVVNKRKPIHQEVELLEAFEVATPTKAGKKALAAVKRSPARKRIESDVPDDDMEIGRPEPSEDILPTKMSKKTSAVVQRSPARKNKADSVSVQRLESPPKTNVTHSKSAGKASVPSHVDEVSVEEDAVMSLEEEDAVDVADIEAEAPESDGASPKRSGKQRAVSDVGHNSAVVESDHDEANAVFAEEPSLENDVMSLALQDPALRPIYKSLPALDEFCDVHPFSKYETGEASPVNFSLLFPSLDQSTRKSLLHGLVFVRSGSFVNTCRVNPDVLVVESNILKIAGTKSTAVGIMLGMVSECFVTEEVMAGPSLSPFAIHRISIIPFPQEMRRDTSVWGKLFKFSDVAGLVSNSVGISFSTRPVKREASSSPSKSGLYMSVSTPARSLAAAGSRVRGHYPASRSFEEPIPIYDGRVKGDTYGFCFSDEEFSALTELPLYGDAKEDLDSTALVAVGYSLSTYTNSKSQERQLSCNLHFTILLGHTLVPV